MPWSEHLAMARAAEEVGFDSIWLGDHLLYRGPGAPEEGPWEAWTMLAALAAVTERVELGPLVACTAFHPPGLIAKMAATIAEVSGGRFVLGLGAGWNEEEFRAFGLPYDHRVSRFEECFTVIRGLLAGERVTLHGRFVRAEDAVVLPPPPARPRLMVGSNGPRMLAATLPYVDAWNTWFADTANSPAGVAPLTELVDAACRDVGRDPAEIERTVAVHVRLPGGRGRTMGNDAQAEQIRPVEGDPATMAHELRAYAAAGIAEVQLVMDPIDRPSIERFAPVLALLDTD